MTIKNLALSTLALAVSASLYAKPKALPAVSPEESIRKAIDNICGDTWCEGDFQFEFTKVVLDKEANQFTVNFVMVPYLDEETVLDDETVTAIVKPGAAVKCVVKGHSNPEKIVSKTGSLDQDVYNAVSNCVNSLENSLIK